MNQELQALEVHLASGRFKAGVARGRWQLVAISWPGAFIKVFDRQLRPTCIRFDCAGYPTRPPQGTPWDYDKQQLLPAYRCPWQGTTAPPMALHACWKSPLGPCSSGNAPTQ